MDEKVARRRGAQLGADDQLVAAPPGVEQPPEEREVAGFEHDKNVHRAKRCERVRHLELDG